jgi:lipopolysaccharide export system protein LptA
MTWRHLGALLMAGQVAVPPAAAQPSGCVLELVSVGRELRSLQVPGGYHQFAGGGVRARCAGRPMTMRADSVAWYSDRGRMDFQGSVQFRDSTVQLASDRANYFTRDERLDAFGNVRLVNLETGSVLTGPNLTYYREIAGVRDTSSIFAAQRPTVEYRSASDMTAPPYVIRADRFRLVGRSAAWAGGTVTIERDDFSASADSAALDSEAGSGILLGTAEAVGRDSAGYRLRGKQIVFRLQDNRLSWLQSRGNAEAESNEWTIAGDTIEFEVARDLIQGGAAWGDSLRPVATSAEQTISADSLVIVAPDQILTEVRGYGSARALTAADSASDAEADWLAGDTLVAEFDEVDEGRRALGMLAATGNAKAFYHIYPAADRTGPPAINYARGRRITVRFSGERLERVDVVDAADGVYLEPPGARRP